MKHLDLYARRDPQLAPYMLREVDIEWKRKCRKVNFVAWIALSTALLLYDQRVSAEAMYFMKSYVELIQQEQDAVDEDVAWRRAKLIGILKLAKSAHARDERWTEADTASAIDLLKDKATDPELGVPRRL